jgi:hypothetical protein
VKKEIQKEYEDFLAAEPVLPPAKLSAQTLKAVHEQLSFSPSFVLLKLGFVHTVTTVFILYICPQLGVSWGASSFSLMDTFMRFGHEICAALCGITLVGATFLFASLTLKPQESFWLRSRMPWAPVALSFATLIFLAAMGAQGQHMEYVFWSVFAIAGGMLAFEIGRKGKLLGFRFIAKLAS